MQTTQAAKKFDIAYYRTILDTLPIPVFVVDNDVRVHDLNLAASELFGVFKREIFNMRGGDALHCLNSLATADGCGRSAACERCVIRNAVRTSLEGEGVTRKRMKFHVATDKGKRDFDILVTANRLPNNSLVLLVLEDVTELIRLKNILPICVRCRKIRDDNQYWQQVEQYFEQHAGLMFSHGLCPGCWDKEMKGLDSLSIE